MTCSTATNHNFNCVIKASLELINLPLIDILAYHVKDVDLFNKINSCQTLLSGRNPLRTDQLKICFLTPPAKPDYRQFDVTLLYKLIRNLCPLLRPTQGWGNKPQPTDTQLGDDIERLRLFRNNYYAHVVSKTIPDTEFEILWRDLKSVIRRIQLKCQTVCSLSYERELLAIENSKFTHDYFKKCEMLLEAFLKLQTDERDEPEVVIEGKDEVLCGDLARFVAVLKPDSSCWSITWQNRRGKVTETIDTSTKKFSGSTNRKLVIQSVCKEDEGEYQVLLSHESNQNGYLKCGNTICLHVFGEVPYLNDLEVTTGDKGIIIHYDISGQSPEVQRIDWKKDDQVLNTNVCKFIGGSINDSSLTIRSPTEEDKGKYSCIITNAVGSVSKDVILDVPSVDIEVNPTVYFGSKATITAVVSSTPPPEQVIWQKSKDENNFYCIDITKPNYYGSNDIPFKPLLVILKATFDDKLNYRLLVRNKIRESISETVHLNVTGSPPNITTSQETNIKCKRLKLIGNVSLYDNSPDILEVFWTKNGEKIDARGSGGRLSDVTIDNPSLIIRDVKVEDAGNYQLTAVNAVGSTTSDVIVLDVPGISFENTENKEDGTQRYVVTIQSVPSPLFVQWSSKGKNEDVYTPIDCNEEDYKGTLNTIPHPVLVVKKSHLENYNYQIEVTNFVGCTVKQISDNQHHLTETVTKENRVYKDRDAGIKFAKLSNYLAKHFPHQEFQSLKFILLVSKKVKNVSALLSASSALECFTILHKENLFTHKDVIFMQFLCKETGCEELYSECIKYALTNKALCYFEKPPDNGYKNVQFHVQGNLDDYTKEQIEHIVEAVADIVECETQDISVNGVKPSNSFFLVLSLKKVYTWKLSKLNEQDCHRLTNLNIDFFIVDFKTIFLQRIKGEEADINSCDKNKQTPLHEASKKGHESTVQLLLEKGADINLCDEFNETPLHKACEWGHKRTVQLLLDKGADINLCDENEQTPLHKACEWGHDSTVQLLLDKGANINSCDTNKETSLHKACEWGYDSTVQLLLDNGADINLCDEYNETPLHKACESGHKRTVQILLDEGADINSCDKYNKTPLHKASESGQERILKLLLDKGADINLCDKNKQTPLHEASKKGHESTVQLLLDKGADINLCDTNKETPLHKASGYGRESIVQRLLEKGAVINSCDNYNETPLHKASEGGHTRTVQLLLDKGADINLCDKYNKTPLHKASESGQESIVQRLLEKGADINSCDNYNETPLHKASESGHTRTVQILLGKGAAINSCDTNKETPLHKACKWGHDSTVQLLLDRGADINSCNKDNETPLHKAKGKGHKSAVQLLLYEGADINSCDKYNETPLHKASESGHKRTVQILKGRSPIGNSKREMQHFAKCRRVQTLTAFCLNSTLSAQNEGRVLETDRDNKGKIILDQDSLLEKRGTSKRDKKSQVCIGIDQPQDNPFTSSGEQHLDTESYLKSPSISPYADSRVDSGEVKIPYKSDEKNPTVKKSHVYENSAMVSDQKRSFKKKGAPLFNPMTLLNQDLLSLRAEHFYHCLQKSPEIVSGHPLGNNPMYSDIDSCAQSIVKGQQAECNTRDFNTQSCSAKNCIHSQRKVNSLQTDSKVKLNSSGELQRQQQSFSVQADQGCWDTCLEMDSKSFELGEKEKVKMKKHSKAFGLDKRIPGKRHSYSK